MLHHALRHVLAPKLPSVRLLATASNTNDLTAYTFTAVDIGGFGARHPMGAHENVLLNNPMLSSPGRAAIVVFVHGEDAAATFGVNSVTIGGVSGTEIFDRGGVTQAVDSAIYIWSAGDLAGIANTDIVVTWSEAVTSCAIGVVEVSNLRSFGVLASGSAFGASNLAVTVTGVADEEAVIGGVVLFCSTCVTGASTEFPSFEIAGAAVPPADGFEPCQIYHESNAEIDFAAFYYLISSVDLGGADRSRFQGNWSGAGQADVVAVYLA